MNKFTFYIGTGTDHAGNKITSLDMRLSMYRLEDFIGLAFGGFTRLHSMGGWKDDAAVILERGLVYTVITEKDWDQASNIAHLARELFKQSAVYMTCEVLHAAKLITREDLQQ